MWAESQGWMIPTKNIKISQSILEKGNKIKAECYANFILAWYLKFEIILNVSFYSMTEAPLEVILWFSGYPHGPQ